MVHTGQRLQVCKDYFSHLPRVLQHKSIPKQSTISESKMYFFHIRYFVLPYFGTINNGNGTGILQRVIM